MFAGIHWIVPFWTSRLARPVSLVGQFIIKEPLIPFRDLNLGITLWCQVMQMSANNACCWFALPGSAHETEFDVWTGPIRKHPYQGSLCFEDQSRVEIRGAPKCHGTLRNRNEANWNGTLKRIKENKGKVRAKPHFTDQVALDSFLRSFKPSHFAKYQLVLCETVSLWKNETETFKRNRGTIKPHRTSLRTKLTIDDMRLSQWNAKENDVSRLERWKNNSCWTRYFLKVGGLESVLSSLLGGFKECIIPQL